MILNPKLFEEVEKTPTRDGYGKGVLKAGKTNKNIVVLSADLAESTRSHWFAEAFPKRFIEVGVAEQNMMGAAAGLALSGKIPFVSSYAVFSPGRSWDHLRVAVCYTNANVKIIGAHAGISVGPDGATHQALEDIAITRVLPNLVVEVPCDALEAEKTTLAIIKRKGPCYLRLGREKTPVITTNKTPFKIGKAEVFREGRDVSIIACGSMVYEALLAAQQLAKEGIDCEVVNNHSIKPIDEKTILKTARKTGRVVTAEEHQVFGGMGSAVAEVLAQHPTRIEFVGMLDCFGESGKPSELMAKYKMDSKAIIKAVHKILQ
ncbi:transketolase family protein [Candidatus Micrarchaeota archaeon]|nr:transketolase family protein [Candidatus Micrarchaeota archaeon]